MNIFPEKIENKFTTHLKSVIGNAENISREFRHESISVEHIILSILSQKGSIGSNLLGVEKPDLKKLQAIVDKIPKVAKWKSKLSEELKNIFKKSVLIAGRYKHSYIGTEHLLYAILLNDDPKIKEIFSSIEINVDNLKQTLGAMMDSAARFSDIVDFLETNPKAQLFGPAVNSMNQSQNNGIMIEMPNPISGINQKQSVLEYFCVDLLQEFEDGLVDQVIGREKEINSLINILSRKSKNNPILVGEPGVGKTAIVQGLAQKIYKGEVPVNILSKRIYSLDLGLLIAGAVFRGEFEARLKDVIHEAQQDPNAILFIDEIHTIIGAGSAGSGGSLDAANILKPPLARGSLSCIGATTHDEYRKQFKKDAALERRFQMVLVDEPSVKDTKKMLFGLKKIYEKHHNLKISEEAINASVDLSVRFINDRFLPDKAIDILDETASFVRGKNLGNNYFKEIKKLEEKRKGLQIEKEKAIEMEKYDEALAVKEEEGNVEKAIKEYFDLQDKENKIEVKEPVGYEDVALIVTKITGVPVQQIVTSERKRLRNLENKLSKEIVGQKEAIEIIAKSIRRSRLGLTDAKRPLGVFLFLGPTGVGKTELAKTLASTMYERQDALIKVDMSEFMEKHNISRLVGAPAGYVGFDEGGKLTEQVRLHPYSIILFDEIEKAHPDIYNIMLQIFEDGELTDAAGRKVDFSNTTIIMTSNIGTSQLTDEAKLGFAEGEDLTGHDKNNKIRDRYIETKESVIKEVQEEFNPEFVNRIDKIIVFNPLGLQDLKSVVKMQFDDFRKRLFDSNGIKISIEKSAIDFISNESFNPNEGARLVRRKLQDLVEDLVSEELVDEKITSGDSLKVAVKKGKITISK
ncbi:ATP-dependent Clp protease ATP-binding subunit [Patescibacteria group bacterium]|nr:ATP-dependent Clp protease ATP-binding subunit [Patescibacteria group bacterium]